MDRVIFRKWNRRHGDGIIATLPDVESNLGYLIMYEHIGQHGEGDYWRLLNETTLAKPDEYADLLKELTDIGYELRIMKRLQ